MQQKDIKDYVKSCLLFCTFISYYHLLFPVETHPKHCIKCWKFLCVCVQYCGLFKNMTFQTHNAQNINLYIDSPFLSLVS